MADRLSPLVMVLNLCASSSSPTANSADGVQCQWTACTVRPQGICALAKNATKVQQGTVNSLGRY